MHLAVHKGITKYINVYNPVKEKQDVTIKLGVDDNAPTAHFCVQILLSQSGILFTELTPGYDKLASDAKNYKTFVIGTSSLMVTFYFALTKL